MVDKIEMSLDDIIKADRSQKRTGAGGGGKRGGPGGGQRRGGAPQRGPRRGVRASPRKSQTPTGNGNGNGGSGVLKGRVRGGIQKPKLARGDVNSAWKHDMFDGPKRGAGLSSGLTKLVVGNLDYGVSNTDIKELFNEFGTLKKAAVHYDRSGRSLGTADVIFERRSDALKAIKQYNGVPLDGRPMTIQLATDLTSLQVQPVGPKNSPLKSRRPVGPAPVRRNGPNGNGGGAPRRTFSSKPRGGGKPSGSRPGAARAPRKNPPTAEELDAELDAYVNDMKA